MDAENELQQLQKLFPQVEAAYLSYCLTHYQDRRVERVSAKLIDAYELPCPCDKNKQLLLLNEVFPLVPVETLRRLIESQSYAGVHTSTEALLANSQLHARPRSVPGQLDEWELFRPAEYVEAARAHLCKEFKNVHRSSVKGIMAENNNDYARSREALRQVANKSWWNHMRLLPFIRRSRAPPPPNPELDRELRCLEECSAEDEMYARALNQQEHEAYGSLLDCECCYGEYAWEDLVTCSAGHFTCKTCLERQVSEGLYGQGHLRGQTSLQCISSAAEPACTAWIPVGLLQQALPHGLYEAMMDAAATQALDKSGLPLLRCPFCNYAEVDDVRLHLRPDFASNRTLFLGTVTAACFFPIFLSLLGLLACLLLLLVLFSRERLRQVARRVRQRRSGTLFRCRNPACLRPSCLECRADFFPFHKCYEKERDGLRIYMERAMAHAVKRTCPRCNISFVKSDGCNKLVCRCGYVLCYVCRKDIRSEGYRHFCEHFRDPPGSPCRECSKCDLYKVEEDAKAVERAAARAKHEYFSCRARGQALPQWTESHCNWSWGALVNEVLEGITGWILA